MAGRPQHDAASTEDPDVNGRILEAFAGVVTERGYAATTVEDIARRAHVPISVVYERFSGLDGCFVAFYRATTAYIVEHVTGVVRAQAEAGFDWRVHTREGTRAYLASLAAQPALAQLAHLEIEAVGAAGRQARRETTDAFARAIEHLTAQGAREGFGVRALDFHTALALVSAAHGLVLRHIEVVGAERLVELTTPVSDVIITLLEAR
ncbi:MAG: TetR/AcrR family transcriptional regulator [Solirubrobacteraceae bacterium]|nr:TetR/AcrR family transcriptional regulator [Solirubrobacteraceae bacterium]